MKSIVKISVLVVAIFISFNAIAQKISLGSDVGDVTNILRDRISHYYAADGSHDMDTDMELKYDDGEIREIKVSVKNGFLYDLRLTANYTIHYFIADRKLEYISTQYENISVDQLKHGFDLLYAQRHISHFYFSEDFTTYQIITKGSNGVATIQEISSFTTRFPIDVAIRLQKMGFSNKFMSIENNKKSKAEGSNLSSDFNLNLFKHPNDRKFIVEPTFDNKNRLTGKIVLDVWINRDGDVVNAKVNKKYSDALDTTFYKECETAVKKSKFNLSLTGPELQKEQLTLKFDAFLSR